MTGLYDIYIHIGFLALLWPSKYILQSDKIEVVALWVTIVVVLHHHKTGLPSARRPEGAKNISYGVDSEGLLELSN